MCLGFVRMLRGEVELAATTLDNARQVDPSAELEFIRVFILASAGRFADARAVLRDNAKEIQEEANLMPVRDRRPLALVAPLAPTVLRSHLAVWLRKDKELEGKIPSVGFIWPTALSAQITPTADYHLIRRNYLCASKLYEYALPPDSRHGSWTYSLAMGTNRINAARAAAQVWAGGGRDAVRATDADRTRFRKLALRWLQEEVADCGRRAGGVSTRDDANRDLHIMKLHRELAPVRDPAYLREMPSDDRELALSIWGKVETLLTKLNPPLNLPALGL